MIAIDPAHVPVGGIDKNPGPLRLPPGSDTGPLRSRWPVMHATPVALSIIGIALVIRILVATGTYFDADEALHYLLVHQASLGDVYRASLTTAHPPLFFLILHVWLRLGASESMLRLLSVLAGSVFLWLAYVWLRELFGVITALIGLLFLSFLPSMLYISTQVRGYAVLLAFIAGALYCQERALRCPSRAMLVTAWFLLSLAILTHYSALIVAACVSAYSLIRMAPRHFPRRIVGLWANLQIATVGICYWLYFTHLSKIRGSGMERYATEGWLATEYLQPSVDSVLGFSIVNTLKVFHYIFSSLVWGIPELGLFFIGLILLLVDGCRASSRVQAPWTVACLLGLPFLLGLLLGLARVYPYGPSRHDSYLVLFAVAGVALSLSRAVAPRIWTALAGFIILAIPWWVTEQQPEWGPPLAHSKSQITAAIQYLKETAPPNGLILCDQETGVMLGYYLARDQILGFPVRINTTLGGGDLREYSFGGYRVVVTGSTWNSNPATFASVLTDMRREYRLNPGHPIWVMDMGSDEMCGALSRHPEALSLDSLQRFGDHVCVLQVENEPPTLQNQTESGPKTG